MIILAIAFAVCAFGITMSIRQSTAFDDDCKAAGGTVYTRGDWLCLNRDGGIIPVERR